MAGVSAGPTPWWQLPEYAGSRNNLEQSAPSGYSYDPVKMGYVKQPSQAGTEVGQFASSAINGIFGSNPLSGGGLSSLQNAAGIGVSGGGAGVTSAATGGPVAGGSAVPGIGPIDNTDANRGAYAKAKDQVGVSSRASLDSLKGEMAANGLSGSGEESQGLTRLVESAAGNLGQVSRDQASTESGQALDIAKTNQGSAVTQRGQDIAAQEANASLAQQQAALKASTSLDMLKIALGLMPQLSISGSTNGGTSAKVGVY